MDQPHSIETEQALLGAILTDNRAYWLVKGIVQAEDFYDPLHAQIFQTVSHALDAGGVATPINMAGKFSGHANITVDVSVKQYLGTLVVRATTTLHAAGYASDIADLALRRQLMDIGTGLHSGAASPTADTGDLIVSATDQLSTLLAKRAGNVNRQTSLLDAGQQVIDGILNYDPSRYISTGLASLDRMTGGWERGQFILVAGRPSMGKTALAVSTALRTARKGSGVLMFSLEMTTAEVAQRAIADVAWTREDQLAYRDMRGPALQHDDRALRRMTSAVEHFGSTPFVVEDRAGITMTEIAARVRHTAADMARKQKRLDVVVIDHLGLVKPSGRYAGNAVQETGEVSRAAKKLAKDMDVAVVALQQLNRGTEARENKRPGLSDLRNSGDLEQDADLVCFAYRAAYYLERGKSDAGSLDEQRRLEMLEATRNSMELIVAKNRNGPTGVIELFCDMKSNAVRDAA